MDKEGSRATTDVMVRVEWWVKEEASLPGRTEDRKSSLGITLFCESLLQTCTEFRPLSVL